jgi:threonine dehydrogenase-like Zn-dependent dehydrogenase
MFQRIQVPSEKVPTARVLIVGAGAMGLVTGYHLQLAGAEITFLVRPTRIEALSKPSTLYSYDDATLKRFDGYKLISQASEAQDIAYDYVLLTLDNVASHSVEGVALLAELGTVTRDTSAMVISGGIGFELRKHVVETMGIAEEHVMSGALGNLAHQVAPAKLPIHPPTRLTLPIATTIYSDFSSKTDFHFRQRASPPSLMQVACRNAPCSAPPEWK